MIHVQREPGIPASVEGSVREPAREARGLDEMLDVAASAALQEDPDVLVLKKSAARR